MFDSDSLCLLRVRKLGDVLLQPSNIFFVTARKIKLQKVLQKGFMNYCSGTSTSKKPRKINDTPVDFPLRNHIREKK